MIADAVLGYSIRVRRYGDGAEEEEEEAEEVKSMSSGEVVYEGRGVNRGRVGNLVDG